MPPYGSDPEDAPLVDSDFESSATSMFSERPRESRAPLNSSDERSAGGYVEEPTVAKKEPNAFKATDIFQQPSYASQPIRQDTPRNTEDSRSPRSAPSLAHSSARGQIAAERPRQVAASLFDKLQRYLPALLIVNAFLLIALILLLTLTPD